MSAVFISYRRADTQQAAGRLADRLSERFGRDAVVIDVDTDQVGRDYRTLIADHLERSGIVLLLVGEGFLAEGEDGRRRIDQPNDLVRLELARALERDVPVIPVLVDGAQMPEHDELPDDIAEVVFRGSVELAHQRFDRDVAFLVERIERFFESQREAEEAAARREAEEEARLETERLAREEADRREAEEAARLLAEEEARRRAEEEALLQAAAVEAARREAEEAARLEAERAARELAAKEAERIAEDRARLENAERARREAEAVAAAARRDAEEARRREEARVARQEPVVAASGDADDIAGPAMATPGPGPGNGSTWDWKRWGLVALAVVLIAGLAGIVVALAGGDEDPAATATAQSDTDDSPAGTESPPETAPQTTETDAATEGFALAGTSVTVAGWQAGDYEAQAIQEALGAFAGSQGMEITYTPEPAIAEALPELVASDAPPDIVLLPTVNLVADTARSGWSVPVPDEVAGVVAAQWPADWILLGAVEGTQFGIPTESGLKSLVYYKPARFDALGYDIPSTWDEMRALTDQSIADGNTPWCVGIEARDATGWVFTDWVEDLVLRIAGADFYDAWTVHDVPFNSPEVEAAWREVLDLWITPGAVYSGGTSIAEFPFEDNGFALAEDRCLMHRQANFLARPGWFPAGTTFGGHDDGIDVFYLPAMGDGGRPVLGIGTYAVALRDAPEVWAVMEHLGSAEYAEARQLAQAARVDSDVSGFLSANTRQSLDVYRPVEQKMVGMLWEGEPMRFDASDLMPPEVGFGSFFFEGTRAVNGEVTVVDAIDAIEASWP